jgi:hypothetical protein
VQKRDFCRYWIEWSTGVDEFTFWRGGEMGVGYGRASRDRARCREGKGRKGRVGVVVGGWDRIDWDGMG